MGSTSLLVAVTIAALLAIGLWTAVRRAMATTRAFPLNTDSPVDVSWQAAASAFRGEALAAFSALGLGCLVAVALWQAGSAWPQGHGLTNALAAGSGAVAGLAVYCLRPRPSWPSEQGGLTVAELSPRGSMSFAKRWVFILPLTAAIALILGLLLAGLYSATDEFGHHRVFRRRVLAGWGVENGQVTDLQYNLSSSGPFPGWYYGVPIMLCTLLLMAVVYLSLHRIAAAPRPAAAHLFAADTALRSLATRFVMTASSAAFAFQFAGLMASAGNILRISHLDAVPSPDLAATAGFTPVEPGYTLALTMLLAAFVVAVDRKSVV